MKKAKSRKKARQVSPIPAGYHTVTPYLACGDGDAAIELHKKAFGALEKVRMPHLATHTEDLSAKELKKRAGKSMQAMS
jgi:hypothetical protein